MSDYRDPPDVTGDAVLDAMVDFVLAPKHHGEATLRTAALCVADAIGCAMAALDDSLLAALRGPIIPGTLVPDGARVPGTSDVLDPVKAAFDISAALRWLDYNDTAPVGGHPSDVMGALCAVADAAGRTALREGRRPITVGGMLAALVDAYEIHGAVAAANRFDRAEIGLDHVIGVKLATAALCTRLLGGDARQVRAALANGWIDGHNLNAIRHVPNAGPRKGWAAADAASRGALLAWMALRGEPGVPAPLAQPVWGFSDVHLRGEPVRISAQLGSFFMDHVIFKLVPGHRTGSTAIEAAAALHDWYRAHRNAIAAIRLTTHRETIRRIVKSGPLPTPAARDHCLQYMVAIALMKGDVRPEDYQDPAAADPEIERLRGLMSVEEDPAYTAAYFDPEQQGCANAIEILTASGESSGRIEVLHPIGDPARRAQALPSIEQKFHRLTEQRWPEARRIHLFSLLSGLHRLPDLPFCTLMDELAEPAP